MSNFICSCHNREFKRKKDLTTHLWRINNKEKYLITEKKYKEVNREEQNVQSLKYYYSNIEKVKEYLKGRYLKNSAQIREKCNKWNRENKIRIKEYELIHKEEIKKWHQNYSKTLQGKAIIKNAFNKRRKFLKNCSKITLDKLKQVYAKSTDLGGNLICCLCFKVIEKEQECLEHNIPVSRVVEFFNIDLNSVENLGLAHKKCNSSKYDKTLKEWFKLYPEYLLNISKK